MYDFKNLNNGGKNKVEFPVDVAVDNVVLREIESNDKILGIKFIFQRVIGDNIAFLTDTLLPPKQEWYTTSKVVGDKTVTAEEQYKNAINAWMGYIRHILIAAGINISVFENITGNTIQELIDNIVKTINPLLDKKTTFYLRTVKDSAGYTKLPKFRGNGVAQATSLGYPDTFKNSDYENTLIQQSLEQGVSDNSTTMNAPNQNPSSENNSSTIPSGLDF